MERIAVQSSNVAEIGYDPDSMILEVLFHNDSLYHYFDVPEVLFRAFVRADSKGRFLHQQIKNNYRYMRVY